LALSREIGYLFVNLKRGTYGFSRTHEVNENETISNFVRAMKRDVRTEDGWDIAFRLTGAQSSIYPDSEQVMKTILDGGETVTAKIIDDEGVQRIARLWRDADGHL
jgi:hypothetical protein